MTNFEFVKNKMSTKCNKEKDNKMKHACINIMYFSYKYLLSFILGIFLDKGEKEMSIFSSSAAQKQGRGN